MGEGIWGLMELFAFFFFFPECLNRFAQPSNFGGGRRRREDATPGRGEARGWCGVPAGVRGDGGRVLKSAGSPAHSRMTGEQGLFSFRIRATESPCVPPTPKHTHTHTPRTSAACARACVCTRSVCLPKKSQQRDPPKIGEEHHHHLTSNYFLFICRLSDDSPPPSPPQGKYLGEERGEEVPLGLG